MRLSQKNKQPLFWANYLSKTETLDEDGNPTGNYAITYTTPVKAYWNVGYIESEAEMQMFGIQSVDIIRIVAEKNSFLLTPESILWYGKEPDAEYDPTKPNHNFIIVGIRPSLNELVFYAKKVSVS